MLVLEWDVSLYADVLERQWIRDDQTLLSSQVCITPDHVPYRTVRYLEPYLLRKPQPMYPSSLRRAKYFIFPVASVTVAPVAGRWWLRITIPLGESIGREGRENSVMHILVVQISHRGCFTL